MNGAAAARANDREEAQTQSILVLNIILPLTAVGTKPPANFGQIGTALLTLEIVVHVA